MNKLRIPSGKLDSFAYFLSSEGDAADLVKELTTQPTSASVVYGAAYDDAINAAHKGARIDNIDVRGLVVPVVPEIEITMGQMQVPISVDVNGHLVTGRLDNLEANVVYDDKLSSSFSVERYINAYQWRVYLLATEATEFVYRISVISGMESKPRITRHEQLRFYPYPGMKQDVEDMVNRFASAIESVGLSEKFKRYGTYSPI